MAILCEVRNCTPETEKHFSMTLSIKKKKKNDFQQLQWQEDKNDDDVIFESRVYFVLFFSFNISNKIHFYPPTISSYASQ